MEKSKTIDIEIVNNRDIAFYYVSIWNGILSLRESEASLLVKFLEKYLQLYQLYKTKEDIYEKLFSSRIRKEIRESLNISEHVFNQRLMYLKKKNVIFIKDGIYYIDDRFIPTKEIVFKFKINS